MLAALGLAAVDVERGGHVIGSQIPADPTGATTVPGVWVAGNVADIRAQVITAAAAGLNAAAAINADLIAEEIDAAVVAYRHELAHDVRASRPGRSATAPSRQVWSGNPNPQLVTEAAAPAAGPGAGRRLRRGRRRRVVGATGLDGDRRRHLGCGTGTGRRARRHPGAEIAGRITWDQADLREQPPTEGGYDLVSAHFFHLPPDARRVLFAGLAAAVAPGGVLLIVGHHPSDLGTTAHRMHFPEMMYTGEQLAADLDPAAWEVRTAEARPRTVTAHEGHGGHAGQEITIHDAVLVARRR